METSQFWKLTNPEYNSDYDHSLINGSLEHPFGMPGVECSVCDATWGGSRILPTTFPETLRTRKEVKDRWPISLEAHKTLQELVLRALAENGVKMDALYPGDSFQPAYLDVPSRPRTDFLWSSLGSLVVSQRVKNLLENSLINDVAFCEVIMRKVGKREARFPAPVPQSGEPEDLIDEVPLLKTLDGVERYYEMIILKESRYPPGGTPRSICVGCGRPDVDNATRRIIMTPEMWKGDSIFFLATTLYVIVTDPVKKLLENIQLSNVRFAKI
jgi:hypothetical protein